MQMNGGSVAYEAAHGVEALHCMSATSRIGIHITEDHSSVLGFRVASFNPDASRYFEVPHAVAYSVSDVTFNGAVTELSTPPTRQGCWSERSISQF